jgi:putative tricarboxylic transport membrane protein
MLSLGFVWQASRYPYLDDTGPGPGFFALWIGGLGVLVGLGMLAWPQAPATESEEPAPTGAGRAILVTLATLVAAAVALEPLGFRLTAFLFLTALLRAYGARWRSALAFAFAAAMLVFLLFDALRLRLPVGALGI